MTYEFHGQCLCGAVTFSGCWADQTLKACHCGQCRRWSGHVWAAGTADELTIKGQVRWFKSSDVAERGFCPTCGSSLFWRRQGSNMIDVAGGAVETPTGLTMGGHIFVQDKGDYYRIADGLPQEERGT